MQKIGFCERYMLTTKVLNKTKKLTRRLEKALQRVVTEYEKKWEKPFSIVSQYYDKGFNKIGICTPNEPVYLSTRYKLGEVVAVAQSYYDVYNERNVNGSFYEWCNIHHLDYKEEIHNMEELQKKEGWSNKLFVRPDLMPHQIQITGVRIERLQDISDEDCLKEGVVKFEYGFFVPGLYRIPSRGVLYSYKTPREAFATLIDRPGVGRKGLWWENPFVVVYEFKLVK